jgi:hypothetical protein
VLDHFIVAGDQIFTFAEHGMLLPKVRDLSKGETWFLQRAVVLRTCSDTCRLTSL